MSSIGISSEVIRNCGNALDPTARTRRAARGCAAAAAVSAGLVTLGLGISSSAATAASTPATPRPKPQSLWRSYPLDPAVRPKPRSGEGKGDRPSSTVETRERAGRNSSAGTDASGNTGWLAAAAAAVLLAAGVVALALRPGLAAAVLRGAERRRLPRLNLSRPKGGGLRMGNAKNRFWPRGEGKPGDEQAAAGGNVDSPQGAETWPGQHGGPPGNVVEMTPGADARAPASVSDVAAEVGSVLKSAEEAAANIRRSAQEEATRLRDEAKAAAKAEVVEARRVAEAERADAQQVRALADSYSEETRSAAEAHAKEVRANAEREAEEMERDARARLERVDAVVEARVRQAEQEARNRLATLQGEAERYRERLESMLAVFRGMSGQLETLLAEDDPAGDAAARDRAKADGDAEEREETLEHALQPDAVASREE